jgi:integrase
MGLGALDVVSLAEARERARDARKLLAEGADPLDARRAATAAARAKEVARLTFKAAAGQYIAAHAAGWRNAKHGEQWQATLRTYVYPVIGDLDVGAIEVAHVMTILDPIWSTKSETASRVRGRIEAVLDWAAARGHRTGDNPARWKGHLDKLLPPKRKVAAVRHQPALPYADLPAFMVDLRGLTSVSARALDFTILTAVRTGETLGARWTEIDFAAKVWTIPGERMKGWSGASRALVGAGDRDPGGAAARGRGRWLGVARRQARAPAIEHGDARGAPRASTGTDRSRLPIDVPGLGRGGNELSA